MIGTFTKNTLITISTQFLIFIFGLGTSVIIARILGPEKKGIYSLALLLPVFLVYFSNLGIGQATVFYLGKKKYSPKEIFGNNIIYTILITILAVLAGLIIIFFFSNELLPGIGTKYLLLSLSLIPGQLFLAFILLILLGLQKIKEYNFILFIHPFFLFISVAILIWLLHLGIMAAIAAEFLSLIFVCIFLFFITKKETNGISMKFNKDYFKDSFLYGIKFYSVSILYFLQSRIVIPLLNFFLNPAVVGFYSVSVGLTDKIWIISDAAGTVLFPKVSSQKNEKEMKEFTPLVFKSILIVLIFLVIILFAGAHWLIILLYSDVFMNSVQPFQILLIGTIAMSGFRILENDLKGRGKPMLNTYIIGISVVLNIILNVLWIPKFKILGAAWATSVSNIITLLIGLIVYCKVSGNRVGDLIFIKKSDLNFYKILFVNFIDKLQVVKGKIK